MFNDTATHRRWSYRDHTLVGSVNVAMLDGQPVDRAEVLTFVRENFGPEAHVLWIG